MAHKERMEQSIKIIKKFLEKQYYADLDNVDIFTLFDIDRNKSNEEIIEYFDNIHKYFHPDMVKQVPLEYRYPYYLIATQIIPTLNFHGIRENNSKLLRQRKDKIAKYQELQKYKDKKELESFYQTAKEKYENDEKIFLIKDNRERIKKNLNNEEIMKIVMNCSNNLINKMGKNYFSIFDINENLTNQEILKSEEYVKLTSVFTEKNSSLIDDYYKENFQKLITLFDEFDYDILHDDENRKKYEESLKPSGPNEYTKTVEALVYEYFNNKKYQDTNDINCFELFKINPNMSIEELKKDNYFNYLCQVMNPDNVKDLSKPAEKYLFLDLCKLYERFLNSLQTNKKDNKYKYEPTYPLNTEKCKRVREKFYSLLEKYIIEKGPIETIKRFTIAIKNNNFDFLSKDTKLKYLNGIRQHDIYRLLINDYGNKDITKLLEKAVNYLITYNINLLKTATIITYDKYGIEQVRYALAQYIKNKDDIYFARKYQKKVGRELIEEIDPEMLKIVIATLLPQELGYLLDDNNKEIKYNKYINEKLITTLLKNHLNTTPEKQGLAK